ncbi:MAG: tripartite tricarboxylate transporter permease [bacterium]
MFILIYNILIITIGVLSGILVGSLPGLTATMTVALLVPLTFKLPEISGILLLVSVYQGAVFGGSIASILIGIPGTPAATATLMDGYPMGQRGQGGKAIGVAAISSSLSGIIGILILYFVSRPVARASLYFRTPEYFALALMGLSMCASLSSKNKLKGIISAVIGLLISTIGMDPAIGIPRFSFGKMILYDGIEYIPAMIGLFGFASILEEINFSGLNKRITEVKAILPSLDELKAIIKTSIIGGILGTIIGAIPGAGANIGAFFSYDLNKRLSKKKNQFGTGIIEGVSAAESGNNGVASGALIPLLTFGIPGDSVTAVLLGALLMHGLRPGYSLFRERWPTLQMIFIGIIAANIILLIAGLSLAKVYAKLLAIPKYYLFPIIMIFCIIGSYSMRNNTFDILVMFVMGILGLFLKKANFSIISLVLGIILGPMLEENLIRSIALSRGNLSIFLTRPVALIFIILSVLSFIGPFILSRLKSN